jgi:hypothetical protein
MVLAEKMTAEVKGRVGWRYGCGPLRSKCPSRIESQNGYSIFCANTCLPRI